MAPQILFIGTAPSVFGKEPVYGIRSTLQSCGDYLVAGEVFRQARVTSSSGVLSTPLTHENYDDRSIMRLLVPVRSRWLGLDSRTGSLV